MINTTISERIFFYRTLKNWSQGELAQKIGDVTGKAPGKDVISQYENGKRKVPSDLVPVLADIFAISTDELFYKPGGTGIEYETENLKKAILNFKVDAEKDIGQAFDNAIIVLEAAREEIEKLKIESAHYRNAALELKSECESYRRHLEKIKAQTEEINPTSGQTAIDKYKDLH